MTFGFLCDDADVPGARPGWSGACLVRGLTSPIDSVERKPGGAIEARGGVATETDVTARQICPR